MAKDRYLLIRDVVFVSLVLILATARSEGNLALSKTATQSSNYLNDMWLANAAVDGCQQTDIHSGCCSHTYKRGRKTAWWRVDLGRISTINSIQIIYRDYPSSPMRLAGYQLYISNTTSSPQDGVLCYQDNSTTEVAVQLNVTHQCPYVGRYVTVYNFRNDPKRYSWYEEYAILELCEVLVYGCPVGSYGNGDCSQVCPETCYGGNCNPKTGSCLYCGPGNHGEVCENACSTNCKDGLCSTDTGHCLDCIPGTFGDTCERTCSVNCNSSGCIKDNGRCYGCVDGKYGDICDMDCSVNCKDGLCDGNTGYCNECTDGKFGNTCELDCSMNCKDRMCVKDTGSCKDCVPNKFGNVCVQDCPTNCQNSWCNKDTGYCVECVAGTYGSSCGQACSVNCKDRECTKSTGRCIECVAGKYGSRCEQDCSVNCKDGVCVKATGNCSECTLGKYGASCDQDCPVNCRDGCTRDNATCEGCKTGRYGTTCTSICPVTCKDFVCGQQTGQCLLDSSNNVEQTSVDSKDIIIAVLAVVCGLLAVTSITTIICLRRYMDHKTFSDKSTDQSGPDTGYSSIDHRNVEPTHVYEMVVTET